MGQAGGGLIASIYPFGFADGSGRTLECEWFNNLTVDQGLIMVTVKLHCPAVAPAGSSLCPWSPGMDFLLTADGVTTVMTTNGRGNINWDRQVFGPVTMREVHTAGYGEPVVICTYAAPAGSSVDTTAFHPEVTGNAISLTFGEEHRGHILWCEWYNMPASASTGTGMPSAALLAPPTHAARMVRRAKPGTISG